MKLQPVAAGVPVATYELTVVKQAWQANGLDPYPGDWSFDYTCDPADFDCLEFTLTDEDPSYTYPAIEEYNYLTLTEDNPGGWTVSVSCKNQNNFEITGGTDSVNLTHDLVNSGDQITCTFTNVADPTTADLTITKETNPDGGQDFPFTLDPGTVTFEHKWGSNGVAAGAFNGPFGVAVDGAGNVYVADTFAYRVQKFDAGGNFILAWGRDVKVGGVTGYEVCLPADTCKAGTNGSGNGEFNLPKGIAVDGDGNVYVSDSFNHRIQVFDANGNYLDQWGSLGGLGGQFDNPNGVAVDEAGNVYVADAFNNRIQKFTAGGTFLLAWGYDVVDDGTVAADFEICTPSDTCWAGIGGTGDGQLDDPFGVAVYGNRVYVADTFNHRVQVFETNGNYLDQWGGTGSGDGQFNHPYGLTADAAGNIYVADTNLFPTFTNDRIQKFDSDGNYLGQWGSEGTGDGQFTSPTGVAVASSGDIYVVDYDLHRVQRFGQTGAVLDDDESHTFPDLAPGTYLVSELVPDDWDLTGIVCDGGSPDVNGNTVEVTLAAGDNVECVFTNDNTPPPTTGSIRVTKEIIGAGTGTFTICVESDCKSFSGGDGEQQTWADLAPGDYTVSEQDAGPDWDEPAAQEVTVVAGQTADATVTNTYDPAPTTADLTIVKAVSGTGAPANWTFGFSGDLGGFSLTEDDPNEARTNLVPGDFDISETNPAGYATTASCDNGDSANDGNLSVTLAAGDDVSCTFTNTICQPGSFDTSTSWACTPAEPGHYVDIRGAAEQNVCAPGYYQPAAGAASCIQADPGYYAPGLAAVEQTACPAGTTSPAGSDSVDDCVATTRTLTLIKTTGEPGYGNNLAYFDWPWADFNGSGPGDVTVPVNAPIMFGSIEPGVYAITELVADGWDLESVTCNSQPMTITNDTVSVDLSTEDMSCVFHNVPESLATETFFFSAKVAGKTSDNVSFGSEDILMWDGSGWSKWFDGDADAGLNPKKTYHNIDAFYIPDPSGEEVFLSFTRNQRPVPGINGMVDGMDVVRWNGTSFSIYLDGQDVGLQNLTAENIDALHMRPGSEWPGTPASCLAYLLISTKGAGNVPKDGGGTLKFSGEDVLGFCLTQAGADTTGRWIMVLDGSTVGMNKGSTDSISLSADGQTLHLTTLAKFTVNGVLLGNKSMVYAYDLTTQTFSGPLFNAPAEGLPKAVDGLQVEGELD